MSNNNIPLNIFQYWHSEELPEKMKLATEKIKNSNPEFNYFLFNEKSALEFLTSNFSEEVIYAFKKLKPSAFKSDLFRYCFLFIHGGIYIDVKLIPFNNFKLIELVNKEHYVKDYTACNNNNAGNISQTIIVSNKNNKLLFECIRRIIINVNNNFYGKSCLLVTGPGLVAKTYRDIEYNTDYIDMLHIGIDFCIKYNNKIILHIYPEYREEQKKYQKEPYYVKLWKDGNIYYSDEEIKN
jgi:mannosyltransferase OCH1-like enzyme